MKKIEENNNTNTKDENHKIFISIIENVVENTIECFIYGRVASLNSSWNLITDNDKCITLREIKIFTMNEIDTYHTDDVKQMLKTQMIFDNGKLFEDIIKKILQNFVVLKKIVLLPECEKASTELVDDKIDSNPNSKPKPISKSNSIQDDYYSMSYCVQLCECFTVCCGIFCI